MQSRVSRRGRAAALMAAVVAVASGVVVTAASTANAAVIDTGAYYQLVNRHSGKALEIDSCIHGRRRRGRPVDPQRRRPGSSGSSSTPAAASTGCASRHSGKVLDVHDRSTADGANVVQWADLNGTNQQFRSWTSTAATSG